MAAKYDDHDGRLRGRGLQARRMRLWAKAAGRCAMCHCLTGIAKDSMHPFNLDHRVPLYKGGEDIEDNLQLLCVPCHDKKTQTDMGNSERVAFSKEGRVVW